MLCHLKGLLDAAKPSLVDTLYKAATRPVQAEEVLEAPNPAEGALAASVGGMGKPERFGNQGRGDHSLVRLLSDPALDG
jgi:hypothetical protein